MPDVLKGVNLKIVLATKVLDKLYPFANFRNAFDQKIEHYQPAAVFSGI